MKLGKFYLFLIQKYKESRRRSW